MGADYWRVEVWWLECWRLDLLGGSISEVDGIVVRSGDGS